MNNVICKVHLYLKNVNKKITVNSSKGFNQFTGYSKKLKQSYGNETHLIHFNWSKVVILHLQMSVVFEALEDNRTLYIL